MQTVIVKINDDAISKLRLISVVMRNNNERYWRVSDLVDTAVKEFVEKYIKKNPLTPKLHLARGDKKMTVMYISAVLLAVSAVSFAIGYYIGSRSIG